MPVSTDTGAGTDPIPGAYLTLERSGEEKALGKERDAFTFRA